MDNLPQIKPFLLADDLDKLLYDRMALDGFTWYFDDGRRTNPSKSQTGKIINFHRFIKISFWVR